MLTLGSLFDGIGGFPLAAVNNGIVPLWASEIEPFPIAVTSKRFPQMLRLGPVPRAVAPVRASSVRLQSPGAYW